MIILGLLAYIFYAVGFWTGSGLLVALGIVIEVAGFIFEVILFAQLIIKANDLGLSVFWWALLGFFFTEISYVFISALEKMRNDNKYLYEAKGKCEKLEKVVLDVNQNVKKVYTALKDEIDKLKESKGEEETEKE